MSLYDHNFQWSNLDNWGFYSLTCPIISDYDIRSEKAHNKNSCKLYLDMHALEDNTD